MDLYRTFLCFTPEDEQLAIAAAGSSALDLSCLHLPLPCPSSVLCFKPRRKFFKLLRCYAGDNVRPRKTRALTLAANFWTSGKLDASTCPAVEESAEFGSEIISETGLQLHRLFDYFPPRDLRKQLEILCCFSEATLIAFEKLPDNLYSALLRAVEFQEARVFFVLSSSSSPSSLPSSLLRDFNAPIITVNSEGQCQAEQQDLACAWKGGIRFYCDKGRKQLSGFQLLTSENNEEAKLTAVPLIPARWIDAIRPIDTGDLCPLLPSGRRFSLCLQSTTCTDAAEFLQFLRSTPGFYCRLPLYSASSDFSGGKTAEQEDFIPPSERWASQLLSELRSDATSHSPPSPICLSFLLLPSSIVSSHINPRLLPFDVILLRQSWELPLPLLLKASVATAEDTDVGSSQEDREAFDAALAAVIGVDRTSSSPVALEGSLDGPRELAALLKNHVASRRCGGSQSDLPAPLLQRKSSEISDGRPSLARKDSEGADHLIEQLLGAFRSDGSPLETSLEIVKPQHRCILDNVEDPTQLDWPHAANVFYHGIYYNRGPWCEKRAERLSKLQAAAIPQETMCTVTRFGCRGNVSNSRPAAEPRSKRKQGSFQEKQSSEQQQVSRSKRHEEKLRAVVSEVLSQEGIQASDQRFAALSFNLFAATKTMIKLQKLPNSRNLRQKMEEAARLQFQVIKQLTNG